MSFSRKLEFLEKNTLLRAVRDKDSSRGRIICIEGKQLINFTSNDYLGLSSLLPLTDTIINAIETFGYGAAGSRLLSGGSILHRILEERLASLKGSERALLYSTGYAANTGSIPALTSDNDIILSDELNHASIIDGCRLSKAKTYVYTHIDVAHLTDLISVPASGKKLVITESLFSMDGDIAPLDDIYEVCRRHKAYLYIDDAHATGVLGRGKGSLEHFGLSVDRFVIQMGTLSKALGTMGGFIAATEEITDFLVNTSRSFIFSTALPAPDIAASLESLNQMEEHPELIENLTFNSSLCRGYLLEAGFSIKGGETPIIPVIFDTVEETLKISEHLYNRGIYVPAIRPPTVKKPRLRISISASHGKEDIEYLVDSMKEAVECPRQ